MIAKNRIPLIITPVIIIIVILFAYLWISGTYPKGMTAIGKPSENFTPEFKDTNYSLSKLPTEVGQEIRHFALRNFTLDKWEFNPVHSNEINLYAHDIHSQGAVEDLQGIQVGNYTIRIIQDIEFETTRAEVGAYLSQLRKNPDSQIAWIGMVTDRINDPPGNYVELWVYGSTPENKKLDNMMIQGWKIKVYPVSPIPSNTGNFSTRSLNTSMEFVPA
jgi:hypothetical protein